MADDSGDARALLSKTVIEMQMSWAQLETAPVCKKEINFVHVRLWDLFITK